MVTNGVFTVTGSGDDIWNSADTFRFVYLTNSSACTVIARVVSMQNSDGWAKAGIMARDSLDPGAANAFIAVTPGNGVTQPTHFGNRLPVAPQQHVAHHM